MIHRALLPAGLLLALVSTLVVAVPAPATADEAPATVESSQSIDGLIVEYADDVEPVGVDGEVVGDNLLDDTHLKLGDDIGFGYDLLEFDAPMSVADAEAAAAELEASDEVISAEPDYTYTVTGAVTETDAPWGLDRIDERQLTLDGTYSYDTESAGAGVTAYIIDTGVRADQKEFTGRISTGFSGISDDYGTSDCHGHGTHVAGTVGGTVYGVAKKVQIVPVRVLGCTGSGEGSSVISGINWVVQNHKDGVPAVANLSIGGPASEAFDKAVQKLIDDGITVVVSSGNDGKSSCDQSPARLPGAITVNASDINDDPYVNTNYGSCSDIYAPGVRITSASASSSTATAVMTGTSMASPHVAGAAARLLSTDPTLTPAQVWAAINSDATAINFGHGSSDANKLLYVGSAASTEAGKGSGASFTRTSTPIITGTRTVGYTLTGVSGSNTPTPDSYSYSWLRDGKRISGATDSTYKLVGADEGHAISVAVTAVKSGYSSSTMTSNETNAVKPGSITASRPSVTGTPAGTKTLVADAGEWTSGTILSYQWLRSGSVIKGATSSKYTLTPADVKSTIKVKVTGTKTGYTARASVSAPTAAVAKPAVTSPTAVKAKPAKAKISLSWAAPAKTSGAKVTDYVVSVRAAGSDKATTYTVAGKSTKGTTIKKLKSGKTYYVAVSAKTAYGQGSKSTEVKLTTK